MPPRLTADPAQHFFRRTVTIAVILVLACNAVTLGQTTTMPLVDGYWKGTETTTVSQSAGNTTTSTTKVGRHEQKDWQGATQVETMTRVYVKTNDKDGKPLSYSYTSDSRIFEAGQILTSTYSETAKFNELGGRTLSTQSRDVNEVTGRVAVGVTISEFDAAGNQLSGEITWTIRQPNVGTEVKKQKFVDGAWQTVGIATPPLTPISLQPGNGAAGEFVSLPDVAGPSSPILATFDDPTQSGPTAQVLVAFEDQSGHSKIFRILADADHFVRFKTLPDTVRVTLFKSFDKDGKPDVNAVHCQIAKDGVVSGSNPVPNVAQSGPAITRASSVYERGGSGKGLVNLQTRGLDPSYPRVFMDGSTEHVRVLAASNASIKAQVDDQTPLGTHLFSVRSAGRTTDDVPADVVALRPDPLPPSVPGIVETLTVHCDGLPPSHPAIMYFMVGGPAQLADGSEIAMVPLVNGIAQVRIRGLRSGTALARYKLHVKIPGFWDAEAVAIVPPDR